MKFHMRFMTFTWLAVIAALSVVVSARAQTGSALAFNGSNDVVTVADNSALNLTGNLTIEAWVKFNETTRTTGNFDRQSIVAKSAVSDSYALVLLNKTFFNDPILRFYHNGSSKSSTSFTWSDVATNRWYHLAVSYDQTMTKIYIDGLLRASNYVNGSISTHSGPLQFGLSGSVYPLDGQLDEVHLWNVARTDAQILGNRNHPAVGTESGLVAAWHFDEGSGSTTTNVGSQQFVGTLNSPQWIGSTVSLNQPVVVTRDAENVTGTQATLRSTISPSGDDTETRFEWGTSTNYDHTTSWTDTGSDLTTHEFSETLTSDSLFYDLNQQVDYHYRGVARNSFGTAYGVDLVFHLPSTDASLSALTVSSGDFSPDFDPATFLYNASVTNASVTVMPTSGNSKATIQARVNLGSFKAVKSGSASDALNLDFGPNVIEIKVTAEDKTTTQSYIVTLNRQPLAPVVTTTTPSNLSATGATFQGTVIPNGLATATWFQWGTTTNYGNSTAVTNIGNGGDSVSVSFAATGLVAGVTYHYRVTAVNNLGQNYGNDVQFSLTFIPSAAQLPPARCTVWCDYDNDGKLDVLVAGLSSTNIAGFGVTPSSRLYHNNGDGTFTWNTNAVLPGIYLGSAAWADYDRDGRPDLLLTGQSYDDQLNTILISRVYHNNGDGTFTWDTNAVLPGINLGVGVWGDYDNDGAPDILLTGMGADAQGNDLPIARLYHNNSDGTFTWNTNAVLPQVHHATAAWGDFDNDGNLDFVLAGQSDSEGVLSRIYRNNGDGTFTDIDAGLPPVLSGSAAWGDFDGDGVPDLLLAGSSSSGAISVVFRNDGDGSFSDIQANLAGVIGGATVWGDFDNDGRPDILLTGLTNSLAGVATALIYHNNGDGTFSDINAGLTGVVSGSAAWGDFNGDGRIDAVLSGYTQNFLGFGLLPVSLVYRNYSLVSNTVPTTPTGLTSFLVSDGALLSWDPSGDAQTPAAGLTYNLRVGSIPGGSDIISPEANKSTGVRAVAENGNAGQRTFALISGLQPLKTYYWSVQSVDSAFAGSAFSAEASFTTAGLPPIAVTLPISDSSNTGAVIQGKVNPNGADTTAWFQWGLTTNYSQTTATSHLGTNVSLIPVSGALNGLLTGSMYHYRVVASNAAGMTYGADRTFEASVFPGRHTGRGSAIALNGVNQYLDVPDDVWFTNAFTVEAWVYVNQTVPNAQLFNFGNGTATDSVRGGLSDGFTGLPYLVVVWQGTEYWVESPTPLAQNAWTHIAFVRDGAATGHIYLNGVEVAAQPLPALSAVVRTNNFIGRGTSPSSYANIIVDEMRIWSVARSRADVQSTMNLPLSGSEPGLKAYWNFNEGSGNVAADLTGHGFDATLMNGPSWVASTVPFPVPIVTTLAAANVTASSATALGMVNPNGSGTTYWFAWGTSTNYDHRTLISDAGAGISSLSANNVLSSLSTGATYYYRIEALNDFGLAWGSALSFVASGSTLLNGQILLSNPSRNPAGTFGFVVSNTSGLNLSVQVSTNLVNWTTLGSLTESPTGSGMYHFTEGTSTNGSRRFYRVQLP